MLRVKICKVKTPGLPGQIIVYKNKSRDLYAKDDQSNIDWNLGEARVAKMENLSVPEPQWILDRRNSGSLFWRRDQAEHSKLRVKFRCDVEVKEFNRNEHEVQEVKEWPEKLEKTSLVLGMTAFFCVMLMILLPWYVLLVGLTN